MPINFTSLLKLGQPVSGTESGTWGDAVNYTVTSYLDIAISGTQTLSADADASLVLTSGTNSATNIGSTTAQYAILNCTGARTALRYINVPNSSKIYVVLNQTTGGFGVTIRGTTGPSTYTTGVTIANGKYAVVAWKEDGVNSDFVIVATNDIAALSGTLAVANGGTGSTTASGARSSLGAAASGANSDITSLTGLTTPLTVAQGGTGAATLTGLVKGSGTGAFTAVTAPSGAVVGTTDTQTLTNKTLTNPTINGFTGDTSVVNIGSGQIYKNTSGNVGFGTTSPSQKLDVNGDASINGARVGRGAGSVSSNTVLGASALSSNTTGAINTAVGGSALYSNQIGVSNSAFGYEALYNNTATGNSAFGASSQRGTTSGEYNASLGDSSLRLNTTGSYNCALGVSAARTNSTGSSNCAFGVGALYNNSTSSRNTAIGDSALYNAVTGDNTAVGAVSLNSINATNTWTNCSALGYSADVTGSNQVQLGNSSTTTYAYGSVQNRSDARDKADVRPTQLGLSFICSLRPVDFKWDYREDYREIRTGPDGKPQVINLPRDGSKKRSRYHHGLIAQEVKAVLDGLGVDFGGFQDHKKKGGEDVLSIGYAELIGPLIKAVQELKDEVDRLKGAK